MTNALTYTTVICCTCNRKSVFGITDICRFVISPLPKRRKFIVFISFFPFLPESVIFYLFCFSLFFRKWFGKLILNLTCSVIFRKLKFWFRLIVRWWTKLFWRTRVTLWVRKKKKINVSEVLLISYLWRRSNFATIIIPFNKAITVASDV